MTSSIDSLPLKLSQLMDKQYDNDFHAPFLHGQYGLSLEGKTLGKPLGVTSLFPEVAFRLINFALPLTINAFP